MTESQIRQKVVATAKSWIGYNEADGSHRKIVDVYNSHRPLARGYALKYTDAWCAGFVSAVAIKLGLTDIMPTEVGVGNMIDLYRRLGRWKEQDSYVPSPGDVIMYAWGDSGVGDCQSGAKASEKGKMNDTMERAKLKSELDDMRRLVDRIPPEILAELKRQQRQHGKER